MQLSRRSVLLGGILSAVLLGVAGLSGQTKTLPTDHLTGTWNINLAKSKFNPADMAPKSGRARITVTQAGIKFSSDGTDGQGRATHTEYTAKFDGKDYPWTGTVDGKPNTDQDAISWKQVDEWTYDVTNKLKGKVTTALHVVITKDGRSATVTITGANAQGQTVSSSAFYDKQQ
jgi:hypothetical protein